MDGDDRPREQADQLGIPGYSGGTPIGAGGFGLVFGARQDAFDREVAVKILAAPLKDEGVRKRFERECKAIGALSGHPHIVTVYDSGVDVFGRPFITMDFMSRGSLADRVRDDGPLPWREVLDTGVKIAGAVATAHAAGILHRDIKPENVLLSSYGEPKLADFGISTAPGASQSRSGVIAGSLSHAAPETLNGRPADERSDVYSLGSLLFFLCCGHAPFQLDGDESLASLVARIVSEPVPSLDAFGVPDSVARAIGRSLSKDPDGRFSSAEDFGRALQETQRAEGCPESMLAVERRGGPSFGARSASAQEIDAGPNVTRRRVDRKIEPAAAVPKVRRSRGRLVAVLAGAAVLGLSVVGAIAFAGGSRAPDAVVLTTPEPPPSPSPAPSPRPTKEPKDDAGRGEKRQDGRKGGDRKPNDKGHRRPGNGGGGRPASGGRSTTIASGGSSGGGGTGGSTSGGNTSGGSTSGGSTSGGGSSGGNTSGGNTSGGGGSSNGKPSGGNANVGTIDPPDVQPPVEVQPSLLPSMPPQG